MFRGARSVVGCLTSLAFVAIGLGVQPMSVGAEVPNAAGGVVIHEVYGGGGNSGATYTNDFIELYNPTASPIDLTGWSVQYRGATAAANTWQRTNLTGSIPANGYFLIQEAAGAAGTLTLPAPNVTGTIAMGATGGVVALVNTQTTLNCTGAACLTPAEVRDLVGYGAADTFTGAAPTAATANSTSASRAADHTNTWTNSTDFIVGAPSPATAVPAPPVDLGIVPISEVQGTGPSSPYVGALATLQGTVTAKYATGGFAGYVIQTQGTGGDTTLAGRTSSDAIFVFSSATVASATVGNQVQVRGQISEFNGLTEITVVSPANFLDLGAPASPPLPITAPWPATEASKETLESMLYTPGGPYTVSNTFNTNNFAEVGLAFGSTPLRTPTDAARPGTGAQAIAADNAARRVTVDDGATTNYLNAANQALTPPFISITNPLRVGATASFHTDVIVDFRNNAWKFQPLAPVTDATDDGFVTFDATREPGPDPALLGDGPIKVASFNVLNYFTTLGAGIAGCTSFNDRAGNPITVNSCPGTGPRGAWNAENLARQQAKIVDAINALDADVVGLMEIENSLVVSGTADAALSTLVDALNADAGADVWEFVPSSAQLPAAGEMDVIANAIIYRPASLSPIGASLALGTESGTGEAFDNAREPLGQVFEPAAGGDPFLVVVNHFKSKGSAGPWPGDADKGDGQGASNESRIRQASALREWVGEVQEASGTEDVFLVGDFNSYTFEDPLQVLYNAGYVNVNDEHGNLKQSYNFSGENGSLDHVLANGSAWERVTGSDIWNVNAPESIALEYSRYNYHGTLFYAPDAFRSSDHDPVVVAIDAEGPPPSDTVELTLVSINDFHGRIDANTLKWAATVEQIVTSSNGNYAITAAGDLVGASVFASAIAQDQPTIDVLNEVGLQASAVGNHEFDQGWADLRDRIIDGGDNAQWDYLGANVYAKGTQDPVLPEYAIVTIDGIRVGVIGAVTEETPALVTPAGIVDLDFGDPVEAVNRVAAQLSDGNDANGEADVLVATFHEGAPSGSSTLEQNIAASETFDEIVNGVSAEVDVLFNGHTHQAYVYSAPVPGAPGTVRPVLQTGNYGDFVGKVVLSVDRTTKEVTVSAAQNVPRLTTADAALLQQYPNLVEVKAIVDAALANAAIQGNVPVGLVTNDITTAYANGSFGPFGYQAERNNTNRDQRNLESTLGGLVANALLDTLEPLGVDLPTDAATIGVVNPGGLRAELFYPRSGAEAADGVITYAEANGVLPFVNNLWTTHLTGAQVKTMLEQQWQTDTNGNVPTRAYLQLGLSDNASYTFDPSLPAGSRITSITIDGQPIDPAATYKIATFSFLVAGGDNFRIFTQGTSAADSGLVDRDAWIAYLGAHAAPPGIAPDYERRSVALTPMPTTLTQGGQLNTTLSYLDMTSLGTAPTTSVDVAIGGVALGAVPVTFTPSANGNAAPTVGTSGSAGVNLTVPPTVPAGAGTLTFTLQPSGRVIEVGVTVDDTIAPAPPVITSPTDGTTTSDATPTIAGTAEPGATVTVFAGGVTLGTTTADGAGAWTLTPTTALGVATHTLTARATDAAGNVSEPSAPVRVTITVPRPAAPVITKPVNGSVTNDKTPTISGTAPAGTTVTVKKGSVVLKTVTVSANGSWSFTAPRLADGQHVITAIAKDKRGVVSDPSTPVRFTVDTVAPSRPKLTSPAQLARVTSAAVPVAGRAEAGSTVTVWVGRLKVGSAIVDANGTWKVTTSPLSNGPQALTARATDAAGNTSSASQPTLIFVCDARAQATRPSLGYKLFCR